MAQMNRLPAVWTVAAVVCPPAIIGDIGVHRWTVFHEHAATSTADPSLHHLCAAAPPPTIVPSMPSLFDPADSQAVLDRIKRLNPATQGQWGIMNVAQMLAHTQQPLRVATGELQLKQGLIGRLVGSYFKRRILTKGFCKNTPTDKSFVVADQRQFEEERTKLVSLIQRFSAKGPDGVSKDPHPFFGKMTTEEWDMMQWMHLDHHLRQFGV
jgi:hypothetical protein